MMSPDRFAGAQFAPGVWFLGLAVCLTAGCEPTKRQPADAQQSGAFNSTQFLQQHESRANEAQSQLTAQLRADNDLKELAWRGITNDIRGVGRLHALVKDERVRLSEYELPESIGTSSGAAYVQAGDWPDERIGVAAVWLRPKGSPPNPERPLSDGKVLVSIKVRLTRSGGRWDVSPNQSFDTPPAPK